MKQNAYVVTVATDTKDGWEKTRLVFHPATETPFGEFKKEGSEALFAEMTLSPLELSQLREPERARADRFRSLMASFSTKILERLFS